MVNSYRHAVLISLGDEIKAYPIAVLPSRYEDIMEAALRSEDDGRSLRIQVATVASLGIYQQ